MSGRDTMLATRTTHIDIWLSGSTPIRPKIRNFSQVKFLSQVKPAGTRETLPTCTTQPPTRISPIKGLVLRRYGSPGFIRFLSPERRTVETRAFLHIRAGQPELGRNLSVR